MGGDGFNLSAEDVLNEGITGAQHAEWDDAVRPDRHAVQRPAHRAVAAKRKRCGKQALHQRAPAANPDAFVGEHRHAVCDQRDVGRCAANVHNDGVIGVRQRTAAERACSGAGKQGFHRVLSRIRAAHQAAVRAHDHNVGRDAALAERLLDRIKEMVGYWEQPGVEQRARAPLQAGQAGKQFAGAHDRKTGLFRQDLRGFPFEHAAVPHAVYLAYCDGFDVVKPFLRICPEGFPVKLLQDFAVDGRFAGQITHIVRVGQAIIGAEPFHAGVVNTEQKQAGAAEFAFHTGIGR